MGLFSKKEPDPPAAPAKAARKQPREPEPPVVLKPRSRSEYWLGGPAGHKGIDYRDLDPD